MLTVTLIMTGFAFFLLGIILGNMFGGKAGKRCATRKIPNKMKISADYKNFYEYDGSEQI